MQVAGYSVVSEVLLEHMSGTHAGMIFATCWLAQRPGVLIAALLFCVDGKQLVIERYNGSDEIELYSEDAAKWFSHFLASQCVKRLRLTLRAFPRHLSHTSFPQA